MSEQESKSKWSGYSDYKDVASRLHNDINEAVDAYSHIDSRSKQGIALTPQTAVNARQAILRIAKRLSQEIQRSADSDLDDIDDRWHEGEDAYMQRLERISFYKDGVPPWLGEMVDDIVKAGWVLGYLKAGREEVADPNDPEEQAKGMFE